MTADHPKDPDADRTEHTDLDEGHRLVGERLGSTIDRYKLLQQIGEGGFGVVYEAEQKEPVRRKVALKIIKLGMDTKQVIARFEVERQALALMDHPSIARVFDAGATDAGRPYFVMELVKGESITAYCDRHSVPIEDRLGLFRQVCEAVQHAHQKGIIHRDLKPSNIMVSLLDGQPVPKVIDFGIAKATSQPLTDQTVFTEQRQLIGTPGYMSPEQAEMGRLDVDTRTDVYSLGVVLYELLTGTTPFDSRRLRSASDDDLQRIIREELPPRPSTRVSASDTSGTIAARRESEPRQLVNRLRGDLDWIVMRALEKDRTRRYETATALSQDVGRYLANEPVMAGPPSARYRLGKFVRRNRGAVLAATMVALALVVGLVGTVTFAIREARQRELALERQAEAEKIVRFQASVLEGVNSQEMGEAILSALREQVRVRLERRWIVAEDGSSRQRTEAELAEELLRFDDVAQPEDAAEIARRMIDTGVLAPAIESLDAEFAEQPLVQARILQTIGNVYYSIGLFESAAEQSRRVLDLRRRHGASSELVQQSMLHLAEDLKTTMRYAEARELAREALALARQVYGEEDLAVAESLNGLAALATILGDYEEGSRLGQEYTDMVVRLTGQGSDDHIGGLWNQSFHAISRGDDRQGEAYAREALRLMESRGEGESRGALTLKHNIATSLVSQGRFAEAEALHREVLAGRRAMLGHRHPGVAYSLAGLVEALTLQREFEGAEPLAREAVAICRETAGGDHPEMDTVLESLGEILLARNRPEEAESVFRELVTIRRSKLGNEHRETIAARQRLAGAWTELGRIDIAESALRECLEMQSSADASASDLALGRSLLGAVLVARGRFAEAEPLLLQGYEDMEPAPHDTLDQANALERLVAGYEAWHEAEPGLGHDEQARAWRAKGVRF